MFEVVVVEVVRSRIGRQASVEQGAAASISDGEAVWPVITKVEKQLSAHLL